METLTETTPTQIRMGDGTLRSEWLVRLRSGLYRQCRHRLREDDGFCALGVLADILVERGQGAWDEYRWFVDGDDDDPYEGMLPKRFFSQAGITEIQAAQIAVANDAGVNFPGIAAMIETYV